MHSDRGGRRWKSLMKSSRKTSRVATTKCSHSSEQPGTVKLPPQTSHRTPAKPQYRFGDIGRLDCVVSSIREQSWKSQAAYDCSPIEPNNHVMVKLNWPPSITSHPGEISVPVRRPRTRHDTSWLCGLQRRNDPLLKKLKRSRVRVSMEEGGY